MNAYIDRLVEMGFLIPNPDAEWHAAPLFVPKPNSRAESHMIVNLRPVNAATKKRVVADASPGVRAPGLRREYMFCISRFLFGLLAVST